MPAAGSSAWKTGRLFGPTPALILLYLVIPAQSRWHVARRIRPLPRFQAVPVVVVSGGFPKPFYPDRLLAVIRHPMQPGERS